MAVLDYSAPHAPSIFSRIGKGIMDAMMSYAHARARTAELQYYLDMSDEQLAAKGLQRDQIAQHVFRDMLI